MHLIVWHKDKLEDNDNSNQDWLRVVETETRVYIILLQEKGKKS